MKFSITVRGDAGSPEEIEVDEPLFLIGRDKKCNLRISSGGVSRLHCCLLFSDGKLVLRDENSSNGTFVNQRRLRGELELRDGDSIQVGPTVIEVAIPEIEHSAGSEADGPPVEGRATLDGFDPITDTNRLGSQELQRLRERLQQDG